MAENIFNNFDAKKAEKSTVYMIDWKAERAQTDRIIQFILKDSETEQHLQRHYHKEGWNGKWTNRKNPEM